MDWTTIFVEDGNEDLIIPQLLQEKSRTTPRLTRLVSKLYHHQHSDNWSDDDDAQVSEGHRLLEVSSYYQHQDPGSSSYSLRSLYFLSINYILGVGCLGIPYAFVRAGFILCSTILLTVTLLSYMTVMWVAETGVRFEQELQDQRTATSSYQRDGAETEISPLLKPGNARLLEAGRYEVIDLVEYYLGHTQKVVYQISLMALMYIGLLAYSQVFCGALGAFILGEARDGAWQVLPQIMFGLMVIPLSCMELDEQVRMQALMATVRFVAIFVIVFGSVTALFLDSSAGNQQHPPYWAQVEHDGCKMSYTSCFSGFGVAFSTVLFSQLFQHSVPGLIRPLKNQQEKLKKVPLTLGMSLLTTSSFYLLLGTTAGSYFGAATLPSINLNFANFTFGVDPSSIPAAWVAALKLISGVVVVFPALDTISVFPLIAITLGNNLFSSTGGETIKLFARVLSWFEAWRSSSYRIDSLLRKRRFSHLSPDERKRNLEVATQVASTFWRLVASIPPLLGSLVATDLSFSFLLAGVTGIYVAFIAPALLQLTSVRKAPYHPNMFSAWYSQVLLCFPVLVFAILALGVVLLQITNAVRETP